MVDCPRLARPRSTRPERMIRPTSAAKWLAAPLAALLLGCAGSPPRGTTVIAKVPERIVILPLNVTSPLPAELQGARGLVWNALEVYLRSHQIKLQTLSPESARGLWLASIKEARSDPKVKNPGFDDAARSFVHKLTGSAQFDALLVPSLYVQRATLSGTVARWDDTEATIAVDVAGRSAQIPDDAPLEGAAPAASLHVVVFGADGAKIQEARAGLALLVGARITPASGARTEPDISFVPRREPFADRAALVLGVARALSPFLPRPSDAAIQEIAGQITAPRRRRAAPPLRRAVWRARGPRSRPCRARG